MAQNKLFPRPTSSPYGMQRVASPMQEPSLTQRPIQRLVGSGPAMAQPPRVLAPDHPLFGMNTSQMQKMVQSQKDKLGMPLPTAQEMGYVPEPVAQQPMAPIGTRRVGGVEFSGTNRSGMNALADNRLSQANSREQILARQNGGAGMTLQQAADPANNFNAGGQFFQGAKLGMNQNGQAFFREGDKPTTYAGGVTDPKIAAANRQSGMQALEDRGVGYIDKATGAFVGRGARTFPSDGQGIGGFAGRLAAGGVTPSSLTTDQLDANRLGTIQRLADKRQSAMARVQQLAQQDTANRRNRLNGGDPLQNMLRNNPQAALAFAAQQNQQQGAERLQQLQNDNALAVENLRAGGQEKRNQIGGLAALVGAGVPVNEARAQLGLPQMAGAQQPGAVPKFQPGSFAGANKQTFDYLKETLAGLNDEDALSLMGEMGVPADKQRGLLDRVKPSWWRRSPDGQPANLLPQGGPAGTGLAPKIIEWFKQNI